MKTLKDEKERLNAEKDALYEKHNVARAKQKELQTAFANVQSMLGLNNKRTTEKTKKQHSQDIS